MASSPERSRAQPVAASHDGSNDGQDHELLRSLNTLSLSTSSTSMLSPALDSQPQFHPERRTSPVSSSTRAPPRTPTARKNSSPMISDPRATTPNLLRKASMNSLHSANGGNTPNKAPSRRGSATPFLSPTTAAHEDIREKPAPTEASVASAYFAKELQLLHDTTSDHTAETIVILHDACYGHRFSRPRTSKSLLSTIVERPERIQASIMGVSMAYVRLGERHAEGKHPIHPSLDPKTLPNVPFRILKTTRSLPLSSPAVTNVHGNKWMDELKVMCNNAEVRLATHANELRRPDVNRGPDAEPPQQLHQGDLYLCPESLSAFEGALGAVCEAVDAVFSNTSHKRAFVAVRPPGHHCSASFPSGFCWVNNVHVGIMHGILNHGLTHAAIIDFDLHHGDGSQAIAWQHNKRGLAKNAAAWKKTSIGYFSVHDINSYPCEYGDEEKVKNASLCIDNAHGQNIWNVHLHEWKSDVEFWRLYQSKYSILLEKTRNYLRLQTERLRASGQVPRAAIFLSAGFDASEWEGAGMQRHKVNVPTEFYARLTRDVVRVAAEEGLGVDGRVISVLEGGYSDRALYSGVLSHVSGLAGVDLVTPKEEGSSGLGYEMGHRMGSFSRRSTLNENELKSWKAHEFPYDPNWWSIAELDRFDAARFPQQAEAKKVTRNITPGNYSSPTQSSNAKMTEVAKIRRTMSGFAASQTIISRPPTPPPPDVHWPAAAHELSKLLIPNNRQVDSCKHSELNTEAVKAKKERRQSLQPRADSASSDAPTALAAPTRKSLRERKPVSYLEEDTPRRKTMGVASVPATPRGSRGIDAKQSRQTGRRLSAASTLDAIRDISVPVGSERPDSSQRIRPESSMSTLNIKKTRPPGPARKESARAPRGPRKTKAAPAKADKMPSNPTQAPVPQGTDTGSGQTASSSNLRVASSGQDLESITNGMRKIKINVLTKEQKEARQKASTGVKLEPRDRLTPTSTSSTSEQPLSLSGAGDGDLDPMQSSLDSLRDFRISTEAEIGGGDGVEDVAEDFPDATPIEVSAGFIPLPPTVTTPTEPTPTSTPFALSPLAQPTLDAAQDTDLFVPYQPDGPPAVTMPIQQPVHILEPNTGTPAKPTFMPPPFQPSSAPVSPVRRGGHGFTATSTIPFSPRPVQETRSMSKEGVSVLLARPASRLREDDGPDSTGQVPETPQSSRHG